MENLTQHRALQLLLAALIIVGVLFAWQVFSLQKAHSTFENYAAFRGCAQITSRDEMAGTCVTKSGQSIKIVRFNDKWFLDGDLPVCAINIGSSCILNWP